MKQKNKEVIMLPFGCSFHRKMLTRVTGECLIRTGEAMIIVEEDF